MALYQSSTSEEDRGVKRSTKVALVGVGALAAVGALAGRDAGDECDRQIDELRRISIETGVPLGDTTAFRLQCEAEQGNLD